MKAPVGLLGKSVSKNKVNIRLTKERWFHIIIAHPEFDNIDFLTALEAIEDPETILKGDKNELLAVKRKPGKNIWFVVVYKEINKKDGFILTAYLTTDDKWLFKRKIVWNKIL